MGRAHSNAWRQVGRFFDVPAEPRLKVACGRDEAALKEFADRWGWEEVETDWRKVLERDDVDVVDISLPTHLHCEIAEAAAKAGKHLFCEKPAALTAAEAERMLAAAEKAGVVHYLNHNYRRAPAVMLAKQLIDEGKIGKIFHWRGAYQQSWGADPARLLNWKLRKATAGGGPWWDLGSHNVDLAHFLVGDIASVQAMMTNFIKERPLEEDPAKMGEVEVEDAALVLAEFSDGAMGTFEMTRFATGRRNRHTFEIYGSEGALAWDLEDMNRLEFSSNDDAEHCRGFRSILATEQMHPYAGNWWPPGHIIGYEHTFVNAVADFLQAIDSGDRITPDFRDGVRIMKVMEAGLESAETGRKIAL